MGAKSSLTLLAALVAGAMVPAAARAEGPVLTSISPAKQPSTAAFAYGKVPFTLYGRNLEAPGTTGVERHDGTAYEVKVRSSHGEGAFWRVPAADVTGSLSTQISFGLEPRWIARADELDFRVDVKGVESNLLRVPVLGLPDGPPRLTSPASVRLPVASTVTDERQRLVWLRGEDFTWDAEPMVNGAAGGSLARFSPGDGELGFYVDARYLRAPGTLRLQVRNVRGWSNVVVGEVYAPAAVAAPAVLRPPMGVLPLVRPLMAPTPTPAAPKLNLPRLR